MSRVKEVGLKIQKFYANARKKIVRRGHTQGSYKQMADKKLKDQCTKAGVVFDAPPEGETATQQVTRRARVKGRLRRAAATQSGARRKYQEVIAELGGFLQGKHATEKTLRAACETAWATYSPAPKNEAQQQQSNRRKTMKVSCERNLVHMAACEKHNDGKRDDGSVGSSSASKLIEGIPATKTREFQGRGVEYCSSGTCAEICGNYLTGATEHFEDVRAKVQATCAKLGAASGAPSTLPEAMFGALVGKEADQALLATVTRLFEERPPKILKSKGGGRSHADVDIYTEGSPSAYYKVLNARAGLVAQSYEETCGKRTRVSGQDMEKLWGEITAMMRSTQFSHRSPEATFVMMLESKVDSTVILRMLWNCMALVRALEAFDSNRPKTVMKHVEERARQWQVEGAHVKSVGSIAAELKASAYFNQNFQSWPQEEQNNVLDLLWSAGNVRWMWHFDHNHYDSAH